MGEASRSIEAKRQMEIIQGAIGFFLRFFLSLIDLSSCLDLGGISLGKILPCQSSLRNIYSLPRGCTQCCGTGSEGDRDAVRDSNMI
jgi:hypothetical protein